MKRNWFILVVVMLFVGCDGEVKVNDQKLDTAGAKLQRTVEKGVDSIGAKLHRLKDKLDKDSVDK